MAAAPDLLRRLKSRVKEELDQYEAIGTVADSETWTRLEKGVNSIAEVAD